MNPTRISLPALPTELIENVLSHVEDKKDLLAIRLTCLNLRIKTQTAFTKVFYHTLETSFSLSSIQRLNHIAQHKDLREQVRELHFVAKGEIERKFSPGQRYRHPHRILTPTFGIGYEWREGRSILEKNIRWDCPAIPNICVLLATSFTHCRSFRIGPDGADWALGDYRRTDCITSLDVLAILLRVVALTGIIVKSFAIESRVLVSEENVAFPARHYLPEFWDFEKFEDGWIALHSLDLEMNEYNFEEELTTVVESAKINGRIISAAKNLKRLRLSFHDADGQDLLLQELCRQGFNPALETLVLNLSKVSADALIALLSQISQSLKTLVFHDILLSSGTWHSVLSFLQNPSLFSKLNNITMVLLRETVVIYSWRRLSFRYFRDHRYLPAPFEDEKFELLDVPGCDTHGLQAIRYRGENMSTALDVLLENFDLIDYEQTRKEEVAPKEKDFEIDEWRW